MNTQWQVTLITEGSQKSTMCGGGGDFYPKLATKPIRMGMSPSLAMPPSGQKSSIDWVDQRTIF
jgi:hypothetical protein